jgi:hypothetical protein
VDNPGSANATVVVDGDYSVRANFLTLAKVLYVNSTPTSDPSEDGSWQHPLNGIQEAIEVATEETAIVVGAGVYRERIDFLGKDILLIGAGTGDTSSAESTVIDGNDAGPVVTFRGGETARCMLMDVVVTHGNAVNGGGVLCKPSSAPTLRRCAIMDNFAMRGAGLYLDAAAAVLIDCRIAGNTAVGGAAMYCRQANPKIVGSVISDNSAVRGGAVYCDRSGPVFIADDIWNNTAGCGGALYCDQSDAYLSTCTLKGNTPSLYCVGSGKPPEIVDCALDPAEPADCSTYCQIIDEFWARVMTTDDPDEVAVMQFLISLWGVIGSAGPAF